MVFFATVGLVFCIAFMAEVRVGKMAGSVDKTAWPHVWLVSQLQILENLVTDKQHGRESGTVCILVVDAIFSNAMISNTPSKEAA